MTRFIACARNTILSCLNGYIFYIFINKFYTKVQRN